MTRIPAAAKTAIKTTSEPESTTHESAMVTSHETARESAAMHEAAADESMTTAETVTAASAEAALAAPLRCEHAHEDQSRNQHSHKDIVPRPNRTIRAVC